MRRLPISLALTLSLICCAGRKAQVGEAPEPGKPRLALTASPRQGFSPLRVTFHASLQGVAENSEEFYCLKEEWDFGDGAVSSETPQCETYSQDTKITLEFFSEHLYDEPGSYSAFFELGDDKLRSIKVSITALESTPGRSSRR